MPQLLTDDIAALVPHHGSMVLLDRVTRFHSDCIECQARMEPVPAHPLAVNGVLPAAALAEYGAQAMAVHGALLAQTGSEPRPGRLVALGQLDLAVDHLAGPVDLDILATRLGGDDSGQMYSFQVSDGRQTLASGQATIMFADRGQSA